MTKRLLAHILAFLLALAPAAAFANGPGTVVFPTTQPYGATFNGTAWSSTGAIVDYNNPANGATVSGGSLQVTVQNVPTVTVQQSTAANLKVDLSGTAANATSINVACTSGCNGANGSVSNTAAAVPAQATYLGANLSGNLTGLTLTANGLKVDPSAVTQPVNAAQVAGSAWATAAAGIPKVGLTDGSGTALTSTGSALDINLKTSAATVNTGTHTLTSSLYAAGTNGFTTTPFSVLTTELNALASAAVATSSVNGTSGVFSQTTTGNAQFGRCWITLGAALGGVAAAGANFSIWFLTSTDGGTTFESQTVSPPPRAADIIIPVGASAYGANAVLMSPPRQSLWAESVKIVLQNNTGQAMGASGNVVKCAPEAVQY